MDFNFNYMTTAKVWSTVRNYELPADTTAIVI